METLKEEKKCKKLKDLREEEVYFGEKFLLEVVAYADCMLFNTTYFENITIYITSPVNIPLKKQVTSVC